MRMAVGATNGATTGSSSRPDLTAAKQRRSGADSIRHLAELGARFTLCGDDSERPKKPRGAGWQRQGHPAAAALTHLAGGGKLAGIVAGDQSHGLVVFDLDAEFPRFQREHHELCGLVVIRDNAPDRGKVILRLNGTVPSGRKYTRPDENKPFFELLAAGATEGSGNNAIVAGTYGGGRYELHGDQPATVTNNELHTIVSQWTNDTRLLELPSKSEAAPPDQTVPTQGVVSTTHGALRAKVSEAKTKSKTKSAALDQIDAAVMERSARTRGDEVAFCCPAHKDTRPSASWNRTREQWHCFACTAGGSWRDLAQRLSITVAAPADQWIARQSALVMSLAWPGISGATRRKVMFAILAIASDARNRAVKFSDRQLAERAGVRLKTAHAHRTALIQAGWLKRLTIGRGASASKFLLLKPPRQLLQEGNISPFGGTQSVMFPLCNNTNADAWRWRGLGETARLVMAVLDAGSVATAAQIAAELHLHRATAGRALRRLEKVGLAHQNTEGWHRGDADVGMVTPTLRTAGAGAKQRQRHEQERADFAVRLVHRKLKRSPFGWEMTLLAGDTGLSLDAIHTALTHSTLAPFIEHHKRGWLRLRRDRQTVLIATLATSDTNAPRRKAG